MKIIKAVQILLLMSLIGCGSNDPLKPGYESTRSSDDVINKAVKNELETRGIEYYTYAEEGKEVIAYHENNREIIKSIFNEVSGGPPPGYTGICNYSLGNAEKRLNLLIKNKIEGIIRESYSMYCVYWKKEYTNKVELIDSNFKEIREHQKSIGNEI